MGKKKSRLSLFSTFVQNINEHEPRGSSSEYHLIDNEYYVAFNSLDDIQQFHSKLTKKQQEQSTNNDDDDVDTHTEDDHNDMDMKTFAEQFLIDLPDHTTKLTENPISTPTKELFSTNQSINWSPKVKDNKKRKSTTPVKRNIELNTKRTRRTIQDLPESSQCTFMSDSDNESQLNSSENIFECLQNEKSSNQISSDNMNAILSTFHDKQTVNETSISIELAEPSMVKNEPIESNEIVIETKEEPMELNTDSTNSLGFGSSNLDQYVQNIHLLHQNSSNIEPTTSTTTSSRPQRIRKQNKLYIEESEIITRPKKAKILMRKKRLQTPASLSSQISSALQLTDAEIEQQFGERLPIVKAEDDDTNQLIMDIQQFGEYEQISNVNQTPIERARAKLLAALERGHDPDTYSLKIRSREHQIIEVQLAIYATADWHPCRTKILAKVEEALRGLRVSWTKIDIHVDNFDIQISTSSQLSKLTPPSNTNSSWFLKALSESGPIIVHIHDRRYPKQRLLIKCSCPECSPKSKTDHTDSSLPVIVNVSPAKTPTRRLMTPTILNKTPQKTKSLMHSIGTSFFSDLIRQCGRATVISVTQCVLDLTLITSVYSSLPILCVSPNYPKEEYKKKYQQTIDPLKCTLSENEINLLSKTSMIARVVSVNPMNNKQSIIVSKPPDILNFYNSIKQSQTNIRDPCAMRDLITKSFSTAITSPSASTQTNIVKSRALILPKPASALPSSSSTMTLVELKKLNEQNRRVSQIHRYEKHHRTHLDNHDLKQQPNCTSFIELKPITSGKQNKVSTIVTANSRSNDAQMTSPSTKNARVIRLSIAKSGSSNTDSQTNSISPSSIRLVADSDTSSSHSNSTGNQGEPVPLVPKQINIIKPLSSSSSSITSAVKLSNPILISHKSQQSSTK